jgi:CheY-like chemotaxis protein
MATDHAPTQGTQPTEEPPGPPERFHELVKDALEHVLDLGYLQRHPLARQLGPTAGASGEAAGLQLRQQLVEAVEVLLPNRQVPFRSPHTRSYHLIRLHYLQGMTVDQAAHELGISERQAYRDLRQGEEDIVGVLRARWQAGDGEEPSAHEVTSMQAEMAQLETHTSPTDLCALLRHAQDAVTQIALQRDVHLKLELPLRAVLVPSDPVIGRTVLVGLLSRAVQQARPGLLRLTLTSEDWGATVSLDYAVGTSVPGIGGGADPVPLPLLDRLGWVVEEAQYEATRTISLRIASRGPTVLVIDDNAGLVKLLERYLTHQACRVVTAADGHAGLRLAQEMLPDAIVLDVMMPEMDGWALLQRLRNHPSTAAIPVIICSVIHDPALAYSLGASLVLHKPINRGMVVDALHQVGAL